jgi:hypothetical protein
MHKINPFEYRTAADRCRQRAQKVENSDEWVRMSPEWENLAQMSERLMAAEFPGNKRQTGSGPNASTG